MSRVILFTRVSTEQQHLESQEDSLRRAAIVDGWSEEDMKVIGKKESAIKLEEEEREGLKELDEELAKGDVDTIYIFELSRLSRRPDLLFKKRKEFLDAKVQLKCLNPSFNLLTPDRTQYDSNASLIFSLFATMAEQEMIQKKVRFHRGRRKLAEEGKYNGGNIPYGYKIDYEQGKLIVIDEQDAALVREIFNLYEGGISQPKLAAEFYRRGNKKMTISFINNILNNDRYTGRKHVYPGSSFERVYPVIITPEQFDRCRKIAKENNTVLGKERNIYYASKLIRCKNCGCFWSASGSKVNYHCYDAFNVMRKYDHYTTPQCTCRLSISINIMDSLLWHICKQEEVNYVVNAASSDAENYKQRIDILVKKLAFTIERLQDIDKKRDRIVEMYIDGALSKERRDAKFHEIDEERKSVLLEQVEYQSEKEHIEGLLNDIVEKYDWNDVNGIEEHLEKITNLQDTIYSISSDTERSAIIHKHVKSVNIENRDIEWQLRYRLRKGLARFITISLYRGETLYFYYLPNSGYGGAILKADKEGNVIERINYEYLERYFDKGKRERNAKAKQQRKEQRETAYPAKRYCFAYSGLGKFLGVCHATAYRYSETLGILKEAKVGMYLKDYVFDKKKVIEILKAIVDSNPTNSNESRRRAWVVKLWNNIPEGNKSI